MGGIFKKEVFKASNEALNELLNEAVDDTLNKKAIDVMSDKVKTRLLEIIIRIVKSEGIKTKDIASNFKISDRTIKNDISLLIKLNIIERIGSIKTGGYFLTKSFKGKS